MAMYWNVPNVPCGGFRTINFPFDISQAPHKEGWYFAQQFNFLGQDSVGYTGLQPRPDDENGQPVIHAAFSSFIDGTTQDDPNCWDTADGGPGVGCAVDFSAPYDHSYHLEIVNTGGTTWTGTCVDDTTGNRIHVGTYTLPSGTQGIMGEQWGFVEYYALEPKECPKVPYTSVTFGHPFTPTDTGSLGNPYENPGAFCTGEQDFKFSRSTAGVRVEAGFKSLPQLHQPLDNVVNQYVIPFQVV